MQVDSIKTRLESAYYGSALETAFTFCCLNSRHYMEGHDASVFECAWKGGSLRTSTRPTYNR